MSTTSNPSAKEAPLPEAIFVSSQSQITAVTSATLTGRLSKAGPFGAAVSHSDSLRSDQLDHEAFEIPVDGMIDLWLARFGNDWVDLEEVDRDTFWLMLYRRLKSIGELEIHYLTDRARYVCRKPK